MKLCKGVLALTALLASCVAAGAQITFSGWGRGVITPLAITSDDAGIHSSVSASTYTSSDNASIGFTANGVAPSGKIGFKIDLAYGGGTAGVGDNAKVWVKPFDILTLEAGLFKEEDFRGKIGASEFASLILPNSGKGEDNIFQRFDATAGAWFKLEPLKSLESPWAGLTIEGAFGSNSLGTSVNSFRALYNLFNNEDVSTEAATYDEDWSTYDGDRKVSALDVYKAMQIALGYRIPDAGLLRVQFIGNNRNVFRWGELTSTNAIVDVEKKLVTGLNTNRDADVIEAAFLFDGIEGLKIDLGAKVPFSYKTKTNIVVYPKVIGVASGYEITNQNKKEFTVQLPYAVAIGASWAPPSGLGPGLTARVDASFGGSIKCAGDTEVENGYDVNAWLLPSYKLTEKLGFGLDAGMESHGEDSLWRNGVTSDPDQTAPSKFLDFGLGPWAGLDLGGGKIKVGVMAMFPGSVRYKANSSSTIYPYSIVFNGNPVFSVPISFTYSF
jgi:hypothetical protein